MNANTTQFVVDSILPAMALRDPIVCGPAVFCTTEHIDRYQLTGEPTSATLRTIQSNCRDSHQRRIVNIGLMLIPADRAAALRAHGLPRTCRDALTFCHISAGTRSSCLKNEHWTVRHSDYFDSLPIRFGSTGPTIQAPTVTDIAPDVTRLSYSMPQHLAQGFFEHDHLLLRSLDHCLNLFSNGRKRRTLRQFFRAVSLSNHAARVLVDKDWTIEDLGLRIVIWVSAFETLVKPSSRNVGWSDVNQLIDRISWTNDVAEKRWTGVRLTIPKYACGPKNTRQDGSAANLLYWRLYQLRNDFAHGNVLYPKKLRMNVKRKKGPGIHDVVPLLFRACLLEQLRIIGILKTDFSQGMDPLFNREYFEAFGMALFRDYSKEV